MAVFFYPRQPAEWCPLEEGFPSLSEENRRGGGESGTQGTSMQVVGATSHLQEAVWQEAVGPECRASRSGEGVQARERGGLGGLLRRTPGRQGLRAQRSKPEMPQREDAKGGCDGL